MGKSRYSFLNGYLENESKNLNGIEQDIYYSTLVLHKRLRVQIIVLYILQFYESKVNNIDGFKHNRYMSIFNILLMFQTLCNFVDECFNRT